MPSLGHVAVGLAARRFHAGPARPRLAATLAFTALATFQDLDVFARRLGAARGSQWLHRGALHSLLAAAAAGCLVALLLGGARPPGWRTAATAIATAASHGILDAFTGGGSGVMFFWPFSAARFLAPWHVLPAAPIGLRYLSQRGLDVLLLEAAWFLPVLLYALWPRRALAPERTPSAG